MIVDDHRLFADVIQATLGDAGFEVSGVAATGDEAIGMVRTDPPDIVLMDIGLPDQSGLVVGKTIRNLVPETRIVALTAIGDHRLAEEAWRAGFDGFLTKDTPVSQFVATLRDLIEGRSVSPGVCSGNHSGNGNGNHGNGNGNHHNGNWKYGEGNEERNHIDLLAGQLTKREREVLALLVEGLAGQAIARRLDVSGNTVRTHVHNILSKLQVHSRLEAATVAVRHQLLDIVGSRRP